MTHTHRTVTVTAVCQICYTDAGNLTLGYRDAGHTRTLGGNEYRVVRVAEEHSPKLVFCESSEELVGVLRGLGVMQPGVNYVFRQLEVGPDAVVSG